MTASKSPERSNANHILAAIGRATDKDLRSSLAAIDMQVGDVICEANAVPTHVYFPEGCVLSLLTVMESGSEIECANIGNEGAFGMLAAISGGGSATRCIVQLAGPAIRCDKAALRRAFQSDPMIQDLIIRYSKTILSQIAQTAGCNALHTIEQRMCRWLLMMHDRGGGDRLTYTHEFLARIIGANRTSVTHAAQSLQRQGFITYNRGLMQIENRSGMEAACCECYSVVKGRFTDFLSRTPTPD